MEHWLGNRVIRISHKLKAINREADHVHSVVKPEDNSGDENQTDPAIAAHHIIREGQPDDDDINQVTVIPKVEA